MRQHVMPPLALDRDRPEPLGAQLCVQLRAAVVSRALRPGERLPSSRALARHLEVSRVVVLDAYQRLEAEGWLEGQQGSGTFVSRSGPAGHRVEAPPAARVPSRTAGVVDLRTGKPWVLGHDQAAWRRAWRSVGDQPPAGELDPYGVPDLRRLLAGHLRRARGVPVEPEHLMVTRGTGHGLDLLAATVVRPGERVGVEEPGYGVARTILAARGAHVVPVPVDEHGLIVGELPGDLTLLYTTPAHQFPIGGRLSQTRREALVAWARRTGALLAEDDYDAEFRYDVAPLPTLYSQAPEQVVLIGTLSKSLSPDIGLGWLIAEPGLLARIARRREELSDRTAGVVQRAVATLIELGDLDRHLHRMRKQYARRRAVILEQLGDLVGGEEAGLHVFVELPQDVTRRAVDEAARRGVRVESIEQYHLGEPRHHGLLIGYGSADVPELERACRILRDILTADKDHGAHPVGPGDAVGAVRDDQMNS